MTETTTGASFTEDGIADEAESAAARAAAHGADRAGAERRRPRAGVGHRHHDLPVLPDARRGHAGARHGGGVGKPDFARGDDPDQAGRRARPRGGAGEGRGGGERLSRHHRRAHRRPRGDGTAAGALARHRTEHRRTAGAPAGHRDDQRGLSAEFRQAARGDHGGNTASLARRSPHLGRPAGDHGAHDGDDRHRSPGADADGDRAVGGVRDARRHGRQRPHHRGAAFRRRRGALHRQGIPRGISWLPA